MRVFSKVTAGAAAAVLPLAVAACSSASSTPSAVTSVSAVSTGQPAGSSGVGTPTGNPFKGLTTSQVLAKAVTDFKAASSVHAAGKLSSSGTTIRLDLTMGAHGCAGTMSQQGFGSFKMVRIGKKVWIKPDKKFWNSAVGGNTSLLGLLYGKYLTTTTSDSTFKDLNGFCNPQQFAGAYLGGVTSAGIIGMGPVTTVSGQQAVNIGGLFVSYSATPEFLRLVAPGSGTLNFTRYNAPVTFKAPPASQTIEGSRYGF